MSKKTDNTTIETIDLSKSFDQDPREFEVHFEPEGVLSTDFEDADYTQVEIVGRGPRGPEGKSAYESWLEAGNVGTIEDFLETLVLDKTVTYIHKQIDPISLWVIDHELGKFPSVTVVDSAGSVVLGEVRYESRDAVLLSFTSEFSGKAYLN